MFGFVVQVGNLLYGRLVIGECCFFALNHLRPPSNASRAGRLRPVRFQLRADGVRETPNPLRSGIHSRGYLPHVKREGAAYFVTFRLADSLPREVLLRWQQQRNQDVHQQEQVNAKARIRKEADRELQRQVERYLDGGAGACLLRRPEIGRMVAEALLYGDGREYLLHEWVVMPNHVHLVLWPIPNHTLSEILRSRKRYTARQANLLLNRVGECSGRLSHTIIGSAMMMSRPEYAGTCGIML